MSPCLSVSRATVIRGQCHQQHLHQHREKFSALQQQDFFFFFNFIKAASVPFYAFFCETTSELSCGL